MPWATRYTIKHLEGVDCKQSPEWSPSPAGGEDTHIKVSTAKDMISLGCKELDMVINVAALKSGMYDYVEQDIKAVVDAACGVPVKTIIEHGPLTNDEDQAGKRDWSKGGRVFHQDWHGLGFRQPTTVETIRLIHETIGDAAKDQGGRRCARPRYCLGYVRRGMHKVWLGVRSCRGILDEVAKRVAARG